MPRTDKRKAAATPQLPKGAVPARVLTKLREICLSLADAYEEQAWTGIRWMVRKRNFAHVVKIEQAWPPAYARAVGEAGPLTVLTFRVSASLRDVLQDADPRFFVAPWGTLWGTKVVGLKLTGRVDWREVRMLVETSHGLLAKGSSQRKFQ